MMWGEGLVFILCPPGPNLAAYTTSPCLLTWRLTAMIQVQKEGSTRKKYV
jgi:hypothetical protein